MYTYILHSYIARIIECYIQNKIPNYPVNLTLTTGLSSVDLYTANQAPADARQRQRSGAGTYCPRVTNSGISRIPRLTP